MSMNELLARIKNRYHLSKSPLKPWHIESGIVFIHIPKCAGISIHHALYGSGNSEHRAYQEYRRDEQKRNTILTYFTVLRDPVERFISAKNYLLNGGRDDMDKYRSRLIKGLSNDQIIQKLKEGGLRDIPHFYHQSFYVQYESDVNFFHIGSINLLGEWLSNEVGRKVEIGKVNQSKDRIINPLAEKDVDIIREYYEKDYQLMEKVF